MLKSSSIRSDLPLLVAASGCASWVDVLQTYQKTCGLLNGIYQPTVQELNSGLKSMDSSRGISAFYYEIIKGSCGHERPDSRLVQTALQRFKCCGNFYAIKRIMEEDVDVSTHEGARSALMYTSFTGMWEHAISLYNGSKRLQDNLGDTRALINILSQNGRWSEAIQVLYRRSPPPLDSIIVKPILRSMGISGEYHRALRLIAASLAQGHPLDDSMLFASIKSLQKTGQWKEALDTALDLGLMSFSRDNIPKQIASYGALVDCLYSINPYSKFTLPDVVDDINYRMSPRKLHTRLVSRADKTFRLISPNEMFRLYRRYISPLSQIFSNVLALGDLQTRPVSELAEAAFKKGDVILVLDTNMVLQCTAKNLPLSHFYPTMRKQYPHLEEKPLQCVILPFTTVRELHQIVWSPSTKLKRAVRVLLWSRILAFVKQPSVTVLALSSEFPCTSFSVITRLAYLRLNEPSSEEDPDLRILNVCLSLQYTFRQQNAILLHKVSLMAEGTVLFSFLKYHVRRHCREVKGVSSEQLLLCTLDKRLSAAAMELGIQTFPRYNAVQETLYDEKKDH